MLEYKTLDLSQCVGSQAPISRQDYWVQPELAFAVGGPNVNVRWFPSFVRVKMKSKWTDSQYRGHVGLVVT